MWIGIIVPALASRGRHGAQARDNENRREERGEQQAPAPQGPTVLPPPPPVDYGVFMQGLVQEMQTQAQTMAALQAQLKAQLRLRLQLQFLRSMAMVVRPSCRGLRGWLYLLLKGRVSPSWHRAGCEKWRSSFEPSVYPHAHKSKKIAFIGQMGTLSLPDELNGTQVTAYLVNNNKSGR
ncbi:hypothetical protein Taro_040740 [Colocasia esculenta]|uniref:Uncharacterized protein n=1 Tax=Colocasia esculenta TaxID=4460 RepID=A0A843W9R0_COLES|nr:hypothetical protein [Colocasia esculenta]